MRSQQKQKYFKNFKVEIEIPAKKKYTQGFEVEVQSQRCAEDSLENPSWGCVPGPNISRRVTVVIPVDSIRTHLSAQVITYLNAG